MNGRRWWFFGTHPKTGSVTILAEAHPKLGESHARVLGHLLADDTKMRLQIHSPKGKGPLSNPKLADHVAYPRWIVYEPAAGYLVATLSGMLTAGQVKKAAKNLATWIGIPLELREELHGGKSNPGTPDPAEGQRWEKRGGGLAAVVTKYRRPMVYFTAGVKRGDMIVEDFKAKYRPEPGRKTNARRQNPQGAMLKFPARGVPKAANLTALERLRDQLDDAHATEYRNQYPGSPVEPDPVTLKERRDFYALDIGGSGAFMVRKSDGAIFGIRGYGSPDYRKGIAYLGELTGYELLRWRWARGPFRVDMKQPQANPSRSLKARIARSYRRLERSGKQRRAKARSRAGKSSRAQLEHEIERHDVRRLLQTGSSQARAYSSAQPPGYGERGRGKTWNPRSAAAWKFIGRGQGGRKVIVTVERLPIPGTPMQGSSSSGFGQLHYATTSAGPGVGIVLVTGKGLEGWAVPPGPSYDKEFALGELRRMRQNPRTPMDQRTLAATFLDQSLGAATEATQKRGPHGPALLKARNDVAAWLDGRRKRFPTKAIYVLAGAANEFHYRSPQSNPKRRNSRELSRVRQQGTRVTAAGTPAARIAALRQIVAESQYAKIDGTMVDLYTASAIVQIYDALNDANRAKFASFPVGMMAKVAFKLMQPKTNPRELSVPDKHQLRIARDTLKLHDAMVGVMGGMTKPEARAVILRLTGRAPVENPSYRLTGTVEEIPDAPPVVRRGPGRPRKVRTAPVELAAPLDPVPFEVPAEAPGRELQAGDRVTVPYSGRASYFGRAATKTRESGIFEGYTYETGERLAFVRVNRGHSVETHAFPVDQVRLHGKTFAEQAAVKRAGRPAKLARLTWKAHGSLAKAEAMLDKATAEHAATEAVAMELYPQHEAQPGRPRGRTAPASREYVNARAKLRRLTERVELLGSVVRSLGGQEYGQATGTDPWATNCRRVANPLRHNGPLQNTRTVRGAKRKRNPRGSERERAVRTFQMWHEFAPHKITRMKGPDRLIPRTLVKLGDIRSIDYISDKYEGRPVTYTHKTDRPRPVLATDPDGRNLHIIGGRVKITGDGLIH